MAKTWMWHPQHDHEFGHGIEERHHTRHHGLVERSWSVGSCLTLSSRRTLLSFFCALCCCLCAGLGFARAQLPLLVIDGRDLALDLLLLGISEFVNSHGVGWCELGSSYVIPYLQSGVISRAGNNGLGSRSVDVCKQIAS